MTSRREFIAVLGGAAAWPLATHAQQGERMRRIGVLSSLAADDPEAAARNAAFLQTPQELGWTDGRNVRIDYRWSAGDAERIRKHAAELSSSRSRPGTAAVYPYRSLVTSGGLISYGTDFDRFVPARRRLRRPHSQGRKARRAAGAGAGEVRAGDQPQDREGARPHRAPDTARPRRRGD